MFAAGRGSAPAAAFANGVASHILELDDIHKGSTVHAAAAIIPAALAVAEREHADGRAFLAAVTIGYEAAFRIGEAVNPSSLLFLPSDRYVATFGAAAAAGSLLKLTADQMVNALGTAGTQAAGLWEFNADGAMSKHLHPGKAAMNGVLAADLARVGFTGATRILEGTRGFFEAMSRGPRQRSDRAALRCFEDHRWPRGSMEDWRERLQAVLMLRPHAHGCRLRARDPRAKELVQRRCAARRERHRD